MKQINFLNTRSFWAAAASVATGIEQVDGGTYDGLIYGAGALLTAIGVIPDPQEFTTTVGPVITAALGIWAYVERLRGKKTVVLGKPLY